ncbi:MAG: sugar transferase [Phycisphaerae bacterium]|nr:sugar transferase [Phycisphaerae bacterium]
MSIFPAIFDCRPGYLRGHQGARSLLLSPLGTGTVLSHFRESLTCITREPLTVVTVFEPDQAYRSAVRNAGIPVGAIVEAGDFRDLLSTYEPSDWLVILDPRHFPASPIDFALLAKEAIERRGATHVVSVDPNVASAQECVRLDADSRVRRIERHYDGVTWLQTSEVSCSFLRVVSALNVAEGGFSSLPGLRRALATTGVLSNDLSLSADTIDLSTPCGLLQLSERMTLETTEERAESPYRSIGETVHVGPGSQIDPGARIRGHVILQEDVIVEPNVVLIGPTVIGARSRIERNSVVAQCLVLQDTVVPRETTVRHRVLADGFIEDVLAKTPGRSMPDCDGCPKALAGQRCAEPVVESRTRKSSMYPAVKRYFEAAFALAGILALSPLLGLVAVLVKLGSRGPVFYGDEREGKDGRVFRCWKFRTMVEDAHAMQRQLYEKNTVDGPQFKLANDPRVTRLGRWLRKTNIDELPQLFNVLLGQMSLIGPRPSPFRENQICVPWRRSRLSVRPGITGLWQICRHERSAGDFHQWIYYDMLYVRHLSPWLDMKILVSTLTTFGGRWPVRLSWLISPRKLASAHEQSAVVTWSPTLDDKAGDGMTPSISTVNSGTGRKRMEPEDAAGRIDALRALCRRALPRMLDRQSGLFVHHLSREGGQDVLSGVSPRYTAIVLLGLCRDDPEAAREVLGDDDRTEMLVRLIDSSERTTDLGEVALTLWAARAMSHPASDRALGRLEAMDPVGGDHPTVEVAWSLTALSIDSDRPGNTGMREGIASRLKASFGSESALFPHWPGGAEKSFWRGHVGCFADQVYPIQALSHYYSRTGDNEAIAAASSCAARICELSGPHGQWWWHYDVRTGRVIEGYPVYSIHQDAMAPMALFDLRAACGIDYRREVERGLSWVFRAPEVDGSLIDWDADVIWRKVARREWGKWSRTAQAFGSRIHPSVRIPGLDLFAPPGRIDRECRPYHLGWLLYAWAGHRGQPSGTPSVGVSSETAS